MKWRRIASYACSSAYGLTFGVCAGMGWVSITPSGICLKWPLIPAVLAMGVFMISSFVLNDQEAS